MLPAGLWSARFFCTMRGTPCPKDPMTHAEQHRVIEEVRERVSRMSRSDEEFFEVCRKRDKDDEDLDDLALKKLLALHAKYAGGRR